MVKPPSTTRHWPVTNDDSSEASQRAALRCPRGRRRAAGAACCEILAHDLGVLGRHEGGVVVEIGVRMPPGSMALARMLWAAYSSAATRVGDAGLGGAVGREAGKA